MKHFHRVEALPGKYRITEREGDEPYEVSNGQWERISAEPHTIGTLDCSRIGEAITLGTVNHSPVALTPPTPTGKPAPSDAETSGH